MKGNVCKVGTVSPNDLLTEYHAPKRIDFMSMDTEGSDFEILKEFDFKKWDVRLLAVELGPIEKDESISKLLQENGYARRYAKFSGGDAWYKKLG